MTQMYKTGAHLVLLKSDVNFDNNDDPPGVGRNEVNAEEAGLGLSLGYDNRDNLFTPGQGMFAEIKATHYDDVLYGDFKYDKIKGKIYSYFPIHPRWVQGLRLDGQFINGNSPFYAEPYIDLRGIPAMRYQGEAVVVAETEARWNFYERWSMVGFCGAGRTATSFGGLDDDKTRWAYGGGFRYLLARGFNFHVGVDIARGPEETAVYLQFGSAWR